MTLAPKWIQLAIFAADEERKARQAGKFPGHERWNDELIEELSQELAKVSRSRQPARSGQSAWSHDELLSSRQVAEMIGRGQRWVQRHAVELGGIYVDGRPVFRASIIREHLEGSAA